MIDAPGDEQWAEAERTVRDFLEATVPAPGAPADRMAAIGRRVRRRRRRNTAVAAVATAVVAILVLPGLSTRVSSDGQTPAASPSFTTAPGPSRSVRLLGAQRPLRVTLPQGWHALAVDDARGGPVAFLSSQPLSRPAAGACVNNPRDTLRTCRPLARLTGQGVLVVLRYDDAYDATDGPPSTSARPPVDSCASVGAQGRSSYRKVLGSTSADPLVLLSVCGRTVAEAERSAAVHAIRTGITMADGT